MNHLPLHRLDHGVQLSDEERAHLESCDRCRVEARMLREVDAAAPPLATLALPFDAPGSGPGLASMETIVRHPDDAEARETPLPSFGGRYVVGETLGAGGMGEVVRARDTVLGRSVAVKRTLPALRRHSGALERFVWEARVGALLQHPGVVPVHDLGTLDDGDLAFVMKEVDGQTLRAAILDPARSRHRLVRALGQVADAVAYAHSREVVHRDLKPPNIMLGSFGEVWVLDWGIARVRGETRAAVETGRSGTGQTQAGAVSGTLPYMAPEQAAGENHRVGPGVDVYAMGVILHEILIGRRPSADERADITARRASTALREQAPRELAVLCEDCLMDDPAARPTAVQLSRRIEEWLDGSHRRAQAQAELDKVAAHQEEAQRLRAEASRRRQDARARLDGLPTWAGAEAREAGRAQLRAAAELDTQAERLEGAVVVAASAALSYDPHRVEAHAVLADHYRAAHAEAEARGEPASALLGLLRLHDRGAHRQYLAGLGAVSVLTPRPAAVRIQRLSLSGDSPGPTEVGTFPTPLRAHPLAAGSYLFSVQAPDGEEVRVPGVVRRAEHWCPVRPGDGDPWIHRLLPPAEDDTVHVPGGWTRIGGDPDCHTSLPRQQVWVDDVIIQRNPVTVADYLFFLNERAAAGRVEEALRWAPRERPARADTLGPLLVQYAPDRGFTLQPDAEGDVWDPRWPIFMVDWAGARAYAAWRGERDGLPWRLPWELEWERAARGADGRVFPWGNLEEPTYAHVAGARPGRGMPGRVGDLRKDAGPLGVGHLAGNVSEWTLDVYSAAGPAVTPDGRFCPPAVEAGPGRRTVRGGNWAQPLSWGRAAFRSGWDDTDRRWVIGFRLARTP